MKLKQIIKENNLGELPSDKLFKYNKSTGKFDKPKDHWKEEHLKSLGDDKLKILVRNRIKMLPGLSQTYNAKNLL